MALFPCAVGRHRYSGPQHAIYFGQSIAGTTNRWKLRLCTAHISQIHDDLAQFEVDVTDDTGSDLWSRPECVTCLQPAGEGDWQLFATSYPSKNDRKDYWGKLHLNCTLPETYTLNKVDL